LFQELIREQSGQEFRQQQGDNKNDKFVIWTALFLVFLIATLILIQLAS
jgi:hypothetical protein